MITKEEVRKKIYRLVEIHAQTKYYSYTLYSHWSNITDRFMEAIDPILKENQELKDKLSDMKGFFSDNNSPL